MERTEPYNRKSTQKGIFIAQDLTLESVKKRGMPANFDFRKYIWKIGETKKEKIAMKVVRKKDRWGNYEQIDYKDLTEIEIMIQISNPFINGLIEYYFQMDKETQKEELVLWQPLAMCDLKRFLYEKYIDLRVRMPENQAIEFLAQLAIGVKAIHDSNVMHRDLNPQKHPRLQKRYGCSPQQGISYLRFLILDVPDLN
eukprot:403341752